MKIAQVSDLHLCDGLAKHFEINSEKNMEIIFNDIKKEKVDLIILSGDLGVDKGLNSLEDILAILNIDYFVVPGNHDNVENLIKNNILNKAQLFENKIVFSDINLILVNSAKGYIDNSQAEMILNNLEEANTNLLFSHFPLIGTNKKILDRELGIKKNINILKNSNCRLEIFSGHYHCATESIDKNIRQVVCPAAIMQINEDTDKIITESFNFGYNIIEVNKQELKYQTKFFVGNGVFKIW